MSGFATAIWLESVLKKGVSVQMMRFFQEFTALPDLQMYFQTGVIYDEEGILNWDADIVTPPLRQSGTLRVKLIYEEPSKPIPVEDPWAE